MASYNGHLDIVALVLGRGADVNMQDKVCVKLKYIYLIHELACNNRDMHANECNKMFIIHTRAVSCLFPHKVPSNSPFESINSN